MKSHRVVKHELEGTAKMWTSVAGTGCPGPVPNALDHPHGIYVDIDFSLYVADTYNNRIQRFAFDKSDGSTVAGFGSSIHFLLNRPTGIVLDADNYLFIVDSHNHRIVRSTQDGFRCIAGSSSTPGSNPSQLRYPYSLAFDKSGNILVTDMQNRRIQLFRLTSNPRVIRDIPVNAQWIQNGVTVAGGNGQGDATHQLYWPHALFVDDDQTIVIADTYNHRIVQGKIGDINRQVVAGGRGQGNRLDQLPNPTDMLIDKETNSLIICSTMRVVRWSRQSGTTQGEILIDNVTCHGLSMDDHRCLYVSDVEKHEVRRYRMGDNVGTLVAGGHGAGDGLNQLNWPRYIFVDQQQAVYVCDWSNNRVMKWNKGATEGIVIAGGQGRGSALTQLDVPNGIFVDTSVTLYVADTWNHRVIRWPKGATQGTVIVGGNGQGQGTNQLQYPRGVSFDRYGNLYVADEWNHRVQLFSIK
ncbi:unnamed protein product [Rotaria sp. Silwood1]|nr:unnamed protein product [Rotaria sp. Silwood1]